MPNVYQMQHNVHPTLHIHGGALKGVHTLGCIVCTFDCILMYIGGVDWVTCARVHCDVILYTLCNILIHIEYIHCFTFLPIYVHWVPTYIVVTLKYM